MTFKPAKLIVVSKFIQIKPKNKSRKQLSYKYFWWVEFFLKMHIVVIYVVLHSISHSSSKKSTSLKSNFKIKKHQVWKESLQITGPL